MQVTKTKGDNEHFRLCLIMYSVIKGKRENSIKKRNLISTLKWPQELNLCLWLGENISLPIVFCCSH